MKRTDYSIIYTDEDIKNIMSKIPVIEPSEDTWFERLFYRMEPHMKDIKSTSASVTKGVITTGSVIVRVMLITGIVIIGTLLFGTILNALLNGQCIIIRF